jgi:cytochrome c553
MRKGALIAALATTLMCAAGAARALSADAEAGRVKSKVCAACHGPDGNARIPGTPSLAGQPTMFTTSQLIKFRDGRRKNDQMTKFVAKLTDEDLVDLAAFYEAQTPKQRPAKLDPQQVEDGKKAAAFYQCTSCHQPDLAGKEQTPRLAGQDIGYLRKLIRGFKEKTASDLDGTMTVSAQLITEEDIEILAQFLASLGGS